MEKVSKRIRISWGSGALGVAILMNVVAFVAVFFMVQVLGINPALAGTLVFISKVVDIITDPIVGRWSDQHKIDGSRRRPFMFYGAFISAISFAMIFTTPEFSNQWVTAAYMLVALVIYTCGYTLFNLTYLCMPAEMTDDYHERTEIHGYRMYFVAVGGLLAQAGVPPLQQWLGADKPETYTIIGIVGGLIILASMLSAYYGTAKAKYTIAAIDETDFIKEYLHVLKNRHFLRVLAIKASQLFGVAAISVSTLFFFEDLLQASFNILAFVGVVSFIFTVASVPLLVRLSKKIGKAKTYALAGSLYVLSALSWVFAGAGEPTWLILIRYAVTGISVSGNIVMAMSMLTDCIEYDARKSGVRREGAYTALYTFTEKFTFALGPLVFGIALSLAGYSGDLAPELTQTPEIRQALLLGMSYIPAAMGAVAIYLLLGYKLTQEELDKVGTSNEK